jgi:SAM-dependent methyltransferase
MVIKRSGRPDPARRCEGDAMAMGQEADPVFYEGHDLEALGDLPRYARWILRPFRPHLRGRVLEIGAGIGNIAVHYAAAVDEAILLEPARNLQPALAARFAQHPHVRTECGTLEEWLDSGRAQAWASRFDAIILVNVLEHIADDYGTIRRAAGLLRPGGKLLLFVPAVRWLYGTLDALVFHQRRYSRSRLVRVVQRAGLQARQVRWFDLAGMFPWLVAGRVLKQRRFNPTAAQVYDRCVVPVAALVERLLPVPLGKNLVCIAERPAVGVVSERRAA